MSIESLEKKRGELATLIRQKADQFNSSDEPWGAEEEANFDQLNKDHNEVVEQINKRRQVADRLKAIEDYDRQPNNPHGIGYNFGNDPEILGDRVPSAKSKRPAEEVEQDRSLSLAGWMRSRMGKPITEEMQQAAQRTGMPLHASELRFSFPGTEQLNRFRSEYLAASPRQRAAAEFNTPLATQTPTAGGNIIPPEELLRMLEINMLAFGGMRQVSGMIMTNSGHPMSWPTADDTSNEATIIGESTNGDNNRDGGPNPTFGKATWGDFKFTSGTILVPYELMEDAAFNIAGVLGGMIGERIARGTNRFYTTGTGVDQPEGILTNAVVGVSTASNTAIDPDEIYSLMHSVDPAYRPGSMFMCSDAIILALRRIRDNDGRYMWQSGFNTTEPDTIAGKPYVINQHMPGLGAGNKVMVFGQLDYYKIRRINEIRFYRLQELYRDRDQDGFVAYVREDGGPLNSGTAPYKIMQLA